MGFFDIFIVFLAYKIWLYTFIKGFLYEISKNNLQILLLLVYN